MFKRTKAAPPPKPTTTKATEALQAYEKAVEELAAYRNEQHRVIEALAYLQEQVDEAERLAIYEAQTYAGAEGPRPGEKNTSVPITSTLFSVRVQHVKKSPFYDVKKLPRWALTPATVAAVDTKSVEALAKLKGKDAQTAIADAFVPGGWNKPRVSVVRTTEVQTGTEETET